MPRRFHLFFVILLLSQYKLPAQTGQSSFHSDQSDFAQATSPRSWHFPRDHGQHPEFRTEWWYFTGNLKNKEGRRFGYQLTFFRTALLPQPVARTSRWAFRDAYIAHFTITDVERSKFFYDQRVARGTLKLADSARDSLQVYAGDWSAEGGNTIIRLKAAASFGSISFLLKNNRSPVLHGQNGLTPKGHQPEEASYYYSMPHLETSGVLRVGETAFEMTGASWMDHEFFTGLEKSEAQGWDWMSMHLSDSTAIMCYLWRTPEGTILPFSGGSLMPADGSRHPIRLSDFKATPFSWWTSAKTGGKYPISWKLKIKDYQLELTSPVENQELDTRATTGVIYWEGYVEIRGKKGNLPVSGLGYLEMTGYADATRPNP
jgi:predicted secreted hydrolase